MTEATAPVARRRQVLRLVLRPAEVFVRIAASGGVLLLLALIAGMVWKNSSFGADYEALWATPLSVRLGSIGLDLSLLGFINDVLMAVFFLVVGAEIKHELVVGELRGVRRAAVPALAALGGMIVPAVVYVVVAPDHREGFGTPMATDIAFALAAIRLLGSRVPDFIVKVLMGLAIIDDLGAIVVIALFYGGEMHVLSLGIAAVCAGVLVVMNLAGVWRIVPYLVVGVPLWLALHHGGVHPTIAGVIVGLCIPATGLAGVDDVKADAAALIELGTRDALSSLERRLEQHEAPLRRLVTTLSPWIHWLILPLFALANGGVDVAGFTLSTLFASVSLGVIAGLVVGKQLGIFVTMWLCVKAKLLPLPADVSFGHVWGMAILGGVGFTMSLFVAGLAFDAGGALHTEARAGILVGSTLSALLGIAVLRMVPTKKVAAADPPEAAPA